MPGSRAGQKLIGPRLTGIPPVIVPPDGTQEAPCPPPGASSIDVIVQCNIALTSIVRRNNSLSINPCRLPGFLKGHAK